MTIPFLAAMADQDGIRQIQRLDGPWELRLVDGSMLELSDGDLRFLITLAPAIKATLDRVSGSQRAEPRPKSPPDPGTSSSGRDGASRSQHPGAQNRSGKPWSDEEDARLTASLRAGATVSSIAEAFGRTPGAILSRCLHLDVISISLKPSSAAVTHSAGS